MFEYRGVKINFRERNVRVAMDDADDYMGVGVRKRVLEGECLTYYSAAGEFGIVFGTEPQQTLEDAYHLIDVAIERVKLTLK